MGVPTSDSELEMYGFEIWHGNKRFSKIKLIWVTFCRIQNISLIVE
jgi:hypothetical protein